MISYEMIIINGLLGGMVALVLVMRIRYVKKLDSLEARIKALEDRHK